MWQPGWEGSLGENGYMYKDGQASLLSTWNYYNIVNWLYSNIKFKKHIFYLVEIIFNYKNILLYIVITLASQSCY